MNVFTAGPMPPPRRTPHRCPKCQKRLVDAALKPGSGYLFAWCKSCKREVAIQV